MAACGEPGEDADLYDAVRAVGEEFCPALGIAIPGRQGLAVHEDGLAATDGARKVVAPVSLIVSAFAPVRDVRRTLTPALQDRSRRDAPAARRSRRRPQPTRRLLPRAGVRARRVAGAGLRRSVAAARRSSRRSPGSATRDSCSPTTIAPTAACSSRCCEMAFAGHCGVEVDLAAGDGEAAPSAALFAEELGAVLQVEASAEKRVLGLAIRSLDEVR